MLQLRQMCILNMATKKAKLSDFTKQTNNANRHKPRGMGMLDSVIAKDGWQSAITVANDNQVFAGSARLEVAQERFGDESEPIVFDIDGTRPVILRRTDIPSADDPRAIRLGIADNRISEINYDPDIELLSAIADSDIDISDLYFDDELAALVAADSEGEKGTNDPNEVWQGMPEFNSTALEHKQLIINFETIDDYYKFAELVNQNLTDKTRSIWIPERITEHTVYVEE